MCTGFPSRSETSMGCVSEQNQLFRQMQELHHSEQEELSRCYLIVRNKYGVLCKQHPKYPPPGGCQSRDGEPCARAFMCWNLAFRV